MIVPFSFCFLQEVFPDLCCSCGKSFFFPCTGSEPIGTSVLGPCPADMLPSPSHSRPAAPLGWTHGRVSAAPALHSAGRAIYGMNEWLEAIKEGLKSSNTLLLVTPWNPFLSWARLEQSGDPASGLPAPPPHQPKVTGLSLLSELGPVLPVCSLAPWGQPSLFLRTPQVKTPKNKVIIMERQACGGDYCLLCPPHLPGGPEPGAAPHPSPLAQGVFPAPGLPVSPCPLSPWEKPLGREWGGGE